MAKITWNGHEKQIDSVRHLDDALDELHERFRQNQPALVTLELDETADSLAIGLGAERSVLNFVPGSKDPPYFTSIGDLTADEVVVFFFMGEWTEFPLRNTIALQTAREAVRQFFSTGKLSDAVEWEQD